MTKLFVGSLPWSTTNDQLLELFQAHGMVASATVVTDKFSGRSKGYGFVEMENDDEAQKAIEALNGSQIEGRTINVSVARPKEDRPDRGNDRGGYRGGDRGGRRDDRRD